jgi:hypothetical protein
VAQRLETIERFRDLAEVGQTKLLILIYRDTPNLVKQIKPAIIEKVISKMLHSSLTATVERECEFNPEYL